MSIAELSHIPALVKVGDALGGDVVTWVTLHDTARIVARWDTGAPLGEQNQRATASFFGKPWLSFVRYETSIGGVGWVAFASLFDPSDVSAAAAWCCSAKGASSRARATSSHALGAGAGSVFRGG